MSAQLTDKAKSYLVKICANKYREDSLLVASYRPDIMGWIFSPKSSRQVKLANIRPYLDEIKRQYPQIRHAAVFAENTIEEIAQTAKENFFDYLQIAEEVSFIFELKKRMWKKKKANCQILPVVRVKEKCSEKSFAAYGNDDYPFLILDRFVADQPGGTGKRLPMDWVSQIQSIPYLLAGGLNPDNVGEALHLCHACGVDVSSGLERKGSPGRKDATKLKDFMQTVREQQAPLQVQTLVSALRKRFF